MWQWNRDFLDSRGIYLMLSHCSQNLKQSLITNISLVMGRQRPQPCRMSPLSHTHIVRVPPSLEVQKSFGVSGRKHIEQAKNEGRWPEVESKKYLEETKNLEERT